MAVSAIPPYGGYQPDYALSRNLYGAAGAPAGASEAVYGPAVSLSLSISTIQKTGELLTADAADESDNASASQTRAGGLEQALQDIFKELEDNQGLTGKVAKRLFKIVNSLNAARGVDVKLGALEPEAREEVRSSRKQLNEFFRAQHDTVLVDQNLVRFIELAARLESLREFALRATELLEALKQSPVADAAAAEKETPPPTAATDIAV